MKYSFNERFTFLVDDMPGENYTQKLQTIAEETGVSAKTLRKYYVAEQDVDYKYDIENANRVKNPKKNLEPLADYFNCTPEYLLGESDIYDREIAAFLADHSEYGLTEDMLLGLKEINQFDNKKVYHDALNALLTNYKHNEAEPYLLLYLIGQYLSPLGNRVEATLSPDIIDNFINASDSIRDTTNLVQTELLKNVVFKKIDDTPKLAAIQNELEEIRTFLNIIQNVAIGYPVSSQDNTMEDRRLPKDVTNDVSVTYNISNKTITE